MAIIQQTQPYSHTQKAKDRQERLLYPSGPELEFMRVMGCTIIPLPFVRQKATGRTGILCVMRGVMRREKMEREVVARGYCIDFGNDIRRGIEVDGNTWHRDIVKEAERDEHLAKSGWLLLHIKEADIYQRPEVVRRRVTDFLTS